jgi:type IV pilus assembly protein PilQ
MHRYLLGLCMALGIGATVPSGLVGAGTDAATLTQIASRIDERAGVIAIEASAPVPYVATQPDPTTFVVELRDIEASGFADNFKADPRQPFTAVEVERGLGTDGGGIARVRMTLSQPQRPKVRSARNMIYVEAERADAAASNVTMSAPAVLPPALSAPGRIMAGPSAVIRDVRASRRGEATAVTFYTTAPVTAASVREVKYPERLIVLDLPNVTSAVPSITGIAQGPVKRVRVGFSRRTPMMTEVSLELSRVAAYRVEAEPGTNNFTVVFDGPPSPVVQTLQTPAIQSPPPPASPASRPALQQAPPAQAAPAAAQTQPVPQAPGAPQGAAGGQTAPPGAPTRFTGDTASFDYQQADLRAVLRAFTQISSLNIVIDPSIQGTVDVALRDVPWDQAFDIILRSNKLGYVVDGTIIRVAPLSVLADEEAQRLKLSEAQAEAGELRSLTRSLSYAKAANLVQLLKDTTLSKRGSVQVDPRTNTIIVSDLAERLARADALLTTLDRSEPQVEIEARIIQTTRDFARQIGIQWGGVGRASAALGNTLPTAFPNQATVAGQTRNSEGDVTSNLVNLGVGAATSGIALALGSINGALNLDVALSALESSGRVRILSTPRVSTQNNVEAEIMQGSQIPVTTVANNTVTTDYRDVALKLMVTPQITASNTVIMQIVVENSQIGQEVRDGIVIDTQRASTRVIVNNGETTVIGGIYTSTERSFQDRTPGLHRVPLLGWLFKKNSVADDSSELLIFITPKISRL